MRILYVSQYFPPEVGAPASRVYELSREWVRIGHQVSVLTAFPHHPTGVKRPEDRLVLSRREEVDGIEVVRTYVYASRNKGIVRRMASYASFMLSSTTIGRIRCSRPDVVIATSPQLLCALGGYGLARSLGVPFVFEVRDLWPESIVAVDAMKDNFLIRRLKGVARFLYNSADRIVTVGDGYRRQIHELYGIPHEAMDMIPNGIDQELFVPGEKHNEIRRDNGWGDRFVVLYMGTHGMAHALSKVLLVAKEFATDPRLLFVFVGEGAERASLREQAAQLELKNVQFIDQQPRSRVPLYYAACDLGLVTLRNTPLFQDVLPSKLFEYLAMERPVLVSAEGEPKRLVEAARAGVAVPPEDSAAMVQAIRYLAQDRDKLAAMGVNGQRYVTENFDRRVLARRYLKLLEPLVAMPRTRRDLDLGETAIASEPRSGHDEISPTAK